MIRFALVFLALGSSALAQTSAECTAELRSLQVSLNTTANALNQTAPQLWSRNDDLQRTIAEYLYFEGELGRMQFNIDQFKAAEDRLNGNIDWVDNRIDFLFNQQQTNQVMNEIFQRQNQQANLMSQRFGFTVQRGKLSTATIGLRRRVNAVRSKLEAQQQTVDDLNQAQSTRHATYVSSLERLNYLQSLDGQAACSETELANTRADVAAKQQLISEIEALGAQAKALQAESENANAKIQDLLADLTL